MAMNQSALLEVLEGLKASAVEDLAAWLLSPHRDDRWAVVITVPSRPHLARS